MIKSESQRRRRDEPAREEACNTNSEAKSRRRGIEERDSSIRAVVKRSWEDLGGRDRGP